MSPSSAAFASNWPTKLLAGWRRTHRAIGTTLLSEAPSPSELDIGPLAGGRPGTEACVEGERRRARRCIHYLEGTPTAIQLRFSVRRLFQVWHGHLLFGQCRRSRPSWSLG